ncbi:Hypothetical predicted protein [Pelobates cultripes]|uniref:Uncharacterized protein n=1 Tax=Pelobates cultripes TaxID=61616 RepID=A0AAD1R9B0_PELCU|nr:Hypothetical predicted protein [Pelobates cultripes]
MHKKRGHLMSQESIIMEAPKPDLKEPSVKVPEDKPPRQNKRIYTYLVTAENQKKRKSVDSDIARAFPGGPADHFSFSQETANCLTVRAEGSSSEVYNCPKQPLLTTDNTTPVSSNQFTDKFLSKPRSPVGLVRSSSESPRHTANIRKHYKSPTPRELIRNPPRNSTNTSIIVSLQSGHNPPAPSASVSPRISRLLPDETVREERIQRLKILCSEYNQKVEELQQHKKL